MAWEWVAPTAAGAVGLAGVSFTWLSGSQGRKHAETLIRQQSNHAVALAREQRIQERRAEAYVEVLDIAEKVGVWAHALRPMTDTVPPRELPPLPDIAAQTRARALVLAFGSQDMLTRIDEWNKAVDAVRRADFLIGLAESPTAKHEQTGINRLDQWQHLDEEFRPNERAARAALAEQARQELSGERRDTKTP